MTGDIKSVSINADGYSASITVEGLSTGGTYAFGIATKNDPTNLKIVFSLTSEGYNNAGTLGTIARTVYGVPCTAPDIGAMRKAYPDHADPDETVSGSDVVIKIALSDFIYNDDISITVDVAAGWYTQDGNASLAANDLAVTNNSTLDYAKVIGAWAVPQRQVIVGTSIHVEFVAFHRAGSAGKPVACVKFTATDDHSHSVTTTVTTLAQSSDSLWGKILVYQADLDLSTFTDGDTPTVRAQAYPWVGDADSVLDTNDGTYTFPTPKYTDLGFRLDKVGDHGHTCVSSSGNDSTGTVYSSKSSAEAGNHFLTIAAALTALQSYNNTNAGHNDAGGGWIYLGEGTWTLNSANGGTLVEWVTITRMSTAAKASTILQPAAANSAFPTFMRLYDITFSGSYYFRGYDTDCLFLDSCACNTTGSLTIWQTPYSVCRNCTGTLALAFAPYSTSNTAWGLVRGNAFSDTHNGVHFCCLGNKNTGVSVRPTTSSTPLNDGGIYAFNRNCPSSTARQFELATADNISHGFAIVQNVFERHGSTTEPLMAISADGTSTTTNHIIMWNNTIAGARANLGYNDGASGGPYAQTNWSIKNNIISNYNNKDDVFGTNPDGYGAWPVGYRVGCSGNHTRCSINDAWFGEFQGLWAVKGTQAVPLDPLYVDDQSADGDNAGNGDYHLTDSSPSLNLAHDMVLPYDYDGRDRSSVDNPGAYTYREVSVPLFRNHLMQQGAM